MSDRGSLPVVSPYLSLSYSLFHPSLLFLLRYFLLCLFSVLSNSKVSFLLNLRKALFRSIKEMYAGLLYSISFYTVCQMMYYASTMLPFFLIPVVLQPCLVYALFCHWLLLLVVRCCSFWKCFYNCSFFQIRNLFLVIKLWWFCLISKYFSTLLMIEQETSHLLLFPKDASFHRSDDSTVHPFSYQFMVCTPMPSEKKKI